MRELLNMKKNKHKSRKKIPKPNENDFTKVDWLLVPVDEVDEIEKIKPYLNFFAVIVIIILGCLAVVEFLSWFLK